MYREYLSYTGAGKVLLDPQLQLSSKVIFGYLALVWEATVTGRSPIVSVGKRKISEALGITRNTVITGIRDLEDRGYIRVIQSGMKRSRYVLKSSLYGWDENKKYK